MTTTEITNVVLTVAFVQLVCDIIARKWVFEHENYERALGVFSRATFNLNKLQEKEGLNPTDKMKKKLEQARIRHAEAASDIAKRHQSPHMWSSVLFVLLYRILSTEYYGKIIAVLPFVPYQFFQRFTLRGIEFPEDAAIDMPAEGSGGVKSPQQACSFLLIYILSTLSVKFFVSQAVAVKPPKGADGGFWTMMDDPKTKKIMEKWGLDSDSLFQDDSNAAPATSAIKKTK